MLEHLFGSKTRLKILQVLFRAPKQSFYVRELARLAGTQLNAVRRELANLERLGIIIIVEKNSASSSEELGVERAKYYRVDGGSLVYDELRALLLKAQMLEEQEVVEAIKKRGGLIKFMLLTGIFTGDDTVNADLLLVGNLKPLVLSKLIKRLEQSLGKQIRYTVMSENEFQERREIGDKFLYGLFESKHLVAVDNYRLN